MKQLRVLHVVNSLESGGMENGICNLANSLAPEGVQTYVGCLERAGAFAQRLPHPEDVTVLGKSRGFSAKSIWKLWRYLRKVRPHIVHTHNLGPLIYAGFASFGGFAARILHGEHSQLAPWETTEKRLRQRARFYRTCRLVHTVSIAQREELIHLGFTRPEIVAIPNGVDTIRFAPSDRQRARETLGLPTLGPIIALVGRFGPYKGHRAMLEAFTPIAAAHPTAVLIFIGGGGSEEVRVKESVAQHPARARIRMMGFRRDMENCYPALDLLLSPSTNEGMSNAALEAMACDVPILANTGCGNEAFIHHGENGWLYDLRSTEALADRVNSLLANAGDLRTAGKKARLTVETDYSLAKMAAAYHSLYRRLAA